MVRIVELRGNPIILKLSDGSSLRVLPYKQLTIKEDMISSDVLEGEKMGFIKIIHSRNSTDTKVSRKLKRKDRVNSEVL